MRRLSSLRVELPLRRIVGIAFLTGWIGLHAQQLTGTHDITGISAFNPSGGQFATIKEAFDSLMSRGVGPGGVTFVVQESWRTTNSSSGRAAEPPTIRLSTYPGAGPNNPVTLTFAGLSDTVYFAKSPNGAAGDRFIFRFTGSVKYFTLDGAGKLILKSTTATGTSGTNTGLIGFVSVGTTTPLDIDAITIQNVVMHGSGRGTTYAGIYIGDDGTLGTTVSTTSNIGTAQGVTIQGCTIDSVSRPILVAGSRTNTRNIRVLQDTLGNPTDPTAWAFANNIGAVHLRGVQYPIVQGCVVHGESNATNYGVAGIRLDECENFTVERNWIYNIRYTGTGGWGSYGIFLNMPSAFIGSPVSNRVSNNMIAGISADGYGFGGLYWVSGIYVQGSSSLADNRLSIIHNSINLYGAYSGASTYHGTSCGITLASSISGGVTIDGNLIQNTFDAANNDTACAIVIRTTSPSPAGFTVNYNQYRVSSPAPTNRFGMWGNTVVPTFADWQALPFTPDANGMLHLPGAVPFVSDVDLHLVSTSPSSAINAGNTAYNGAFDFDGETRPIGGGSDPGTAPDVGADELDGTPFSCPSSLQAPEIVVTGTYPPLAGSDYLWGQQVEIDTTGTNSPTPSGALNLIYSLDGGATWTAGPSVSSFPVTITLPPLTPPTYTGTLTIAVVATGPSFCGLTPDTSNSPVSINLTDRPGNRATTATSITLTPSGPGMWTATISDSTSGPGLSNEYAGLPRAQASRDLFFLIQLPACLDSLDISLCGTTGTLTDSYIHLINATAGDTIDSDDGCSTGLLSRIVAIGTPNANTRNASDLSKPARDSLLLVQAHTLYLVVEGYGSATGTFTVNITGYKMRPSSINITGAPTGPVCINSNPITLDATTPGATDYLWLDANGNPIATGATYTFDPNTEGIFPVTAAVSFESPNQDPINCAPDVLTASVTITVEDTARAQIADASNNVVSGQTLSFTPGSDVTLNVSSPQTPGNSYTWNLYNAIPPSGTPTTTSTGSPFNINNISAGDYTVILEAVRGTGACGTTRDTVYLNVTTGLRTDAGPFSIFPNPNTGAFTIAAPAMDTYRVQVLDVAGRLVAEDAFTGSTHQMRVSLPAGIYQVRLIAGEKVQVGRLIITE
jgi:hypothetical protein